MQLSYNIIMRIYLYIIIFLLSTVGHVRAEVFTELFGIKLLDQVQNHFSLKMINNDKFKNPETIENFYDVEITNVIKKKSPQIDFYTITLDNNNRIHSIYGEKQLDTISNCNNRVVPSIISIFERKYSLSFDYYEDSYTDFNIYSYSTYDDSDNLLRIQCNEGIDGLIYIQIVYQTLELIDEVNRFYDSGF